MTDKIVLWRPGFKNNSVISYLFQNDTMTVLSHPKVSDESKQNYRLISYLHFNGTMFLKDFV